MHGTAEVARHAAHAIQDGVGTLPAGELEVGAGRKEGAQVQPLVDHPEGGQGLGRTHCLGLRNEGGHSGRGSMTDSAGAVQGWRGRESNSPEQGPPLSRLRKHAHGIWSRGASIHCTAEQQTHKRLCLEDEGPQLGDKASIPARCRIKEQVGEGGTTGRKCHGHQDNAPRCPPSGVDPLPRTLPGSALSPLQAH